MPVLLARGLTKSFGGVGALADLDLAIDEGEMVALIGPNGAGKSTCFNILGGQLAADAGSVEILGHRALGLPPRAIWRLGVGRTFQITATFCFDDRPRERADGAPLRAPADPVTSTAHRPAADGLRVYAP